jgi:hypothetical protein
MGVINYAGWGEKSGTFEKQRQKIGKRLEKSRFPKKYNTLLDDPEAVLMSFLH